MRPVATSYFAPCQGHTRHPSLSIRPLARSAKRCRHRLDTAKSCPLEFPTAYWPAPTTLPGVSSDAGPTLISSAISYLPGGTERDATPPPPDHASEHWEPSTARRVPAHCPAGSRKFPPFTSTTGGKFRPLYPVGQAITRRGVGA